MSGPPNGGGLPPTLPDPAPHPGSSDHAADLVDRLLRRIRSYRRAHAVVAFSGGVDSATVVALAARALGRGAVEAVTAVSPSYPSGELEQAREVAGGLGVRYRVVQTREVDREAYARNDPDRCFHCKLELYATIRKVVETAGSRAVVMAGANADDLDDVRPGLRAADRHGVRNPLLEEGVGKSGVRAVARSLGLAVAEKPALACLSSRVTYGIRITPELLARIDAAERLVRALGFRVVRARHLGEAVSIEVAPEDVGTLLSSPELPGLRAALSGMGWREVRIDPRGYRQGSLNDALPLRAASSGRASGREGTRGP